MNTKEYASICRGLLVLTNCLNNVIDSTGNREGLTEKNKDEIVKAYLRAKEFLPARTINKRLKISSQRISRWTKERKCTSSLIKHCFLSCPAQLTLSEQMLLKEYLMDPNNSNLPRNHIWALARRKGLFVSLPTFYRYSQQACGKPKPPELEKRETIRIRAQNPFQILHMDSTRITCKNGERIYVHFIMDNYSRKILGAVPSYSSKSEHVALNLKRVLGRYHLYNHRFELFCDDGPENKGYIYDLLESDKRIRITKIVANYEERTDNNMIEYWNRKFKYVIMKKFNPKNFDNLEELLPEMIKYSNSLYLPVLRTLTPNEAARGFQYEDFDFRLKVENAKRLRIFQNQTVDCDKLCLTQA